MTDNRIFALVGRWDGSQDPHAVRVIAVTPSCPPPILKARPADRWTIEDFILVRKLGQGYASSVYLAVCKFSKESVILKITKKAGLSMLNDYQIRREIAIHSRLQHVNLCALHAAFEDNEAYYAIQEHCAGGDLFQKMQQRRTVFTEKECVAKILLPLLKSLYYMHSRGVIHRDVSFIKDTRLLSLKVSLLSVLGLLFEGSAPPTAPSSLSPNSSRLSPFSPPNTRPKHLSTHL